MSIETAVIPLAGAGTRNLPETSAVEKCLMPVYTNEGAIPVVDFMVRDCAAAGLQRVIFITTPRGQEQLTDYFGAIPGHLTQQLTALGKTAPLELEQARRDSYGLQIEYIIQLPQPYGTTVPIYLAKSALQGEKRFALMGGDDFVYHPDGTSEMAEAIKGWEENGADHAIMGLPVSRESAPNYGILQARNRRLIAIDEKPPLSRVPQHPVANISRYLLSDAIWTEIEAEMATDRGQNEHYVTYPIAAALEHGQSFYIHPVTGYYLDGGSPQGLRKASNFIADNPPFSPLG